MKTIVLMRHAEAQPAHLHAVDWDRPLALQGLQQLERIRGQVQKISTPISSVLCSNARRARQTLEAVRPLFSPKCEYTFTDQLYKATPEVLMTLVQETSESHEGIFMVGHNPSLSQFLESVVIRSPSAQKKSFLNPACLAVFSAQCPQWKDLSFTKIQLTSILSPD